MSSYNIPERDFMRCFRKALSVPFLLNNVCSTNIQEFVTSYAASLGCTEKSFFFPLLTCAASCMGTESYLEIINHWIEPPIVWTLVIAPKSLLRVDVAEHVKQHLLKAQNDTWVLHKNEDTKDYLKKFLFDIFTLEQLQEMLKLSNGHGIAIYNSARSLHKNMLEPVEADIMLRLHSGLAWFQDSRVSRSTVTKTRVNFAIISTPAAVHQTLTSAPNFKELFHQSFLLTCTEDSHAKFNQISEVNNSDKLVEIFTSLIKLHCSHGPIVYKLSAEGKEKFSEIHDELTDKAKQMARKNADKVFQPALSYLGRLTLILHVLDNVIDSINYQIPVSHLTWNTEISANTVWHARELLSHFIEQRHALMEELKFPSQSGAPTPPIEVVDGQNRVVSRNMLTPPQRSPQNVMMRSNNSVNTVNPVNNVRRNILNNSRVRQPVRNYQPPLPLNSTVVEPIIQSVRSNAIPATQTIPFNPIITNCETLNNNLNTELNLPTALSVSRSEDQADQAIPVLLSRAPNTSISDISKEDFIRTQRNSLKKLLKHTTGEITPSRCVQLKLTPDATASDETQRYTQNFSRLFLKRLELFGFGICEGANNGNKRHFVFKKKKFSALGDDQRQILNDLNISEVEYNKCFTSVSIENEQNGKVVCLE
ncbi:uncharacterized protein [Parasteatoda tepidariorum]|uniref:Uncharacterized protein n=1 Tax=Parasteatoda tepidariorum TaxID=114398 RepID=A0A2L2YEZ8_PARTP|nr:uncharacterized protein LOC107452143 [Parasteatoda tepidariorum]XP_042895088.1 uncharacterized protein LOC107452143 [Parasteatoda tepidariorum]XP_042895089.1 uncharacterized protein LOC107452143 [Parasteatoda tepidariorum]